jgi:hypothetical protein
MRLGSGGRNDLAKGWRISDASPPASAPSTIMTVAPSVVPPARAPLAAARGRYRVDEVGSRRNGCGALGRHCRGLVRHQQRRPNCGCNRNCEIKSARHSSQHVRFSLSCRHYSNAPLAPAHCAIGIVVNSSMRVRWQTLWILDVPAQTAAGSSELIRHVEYVKETCGPDAWVRAREPRALVDPCRASSRPLTPCRSPGALRNPLQDPIFESSQYADWYAIVSGPGIQNPTNQGFNLPAGINKHLNFVVP